MVAENSFEQSHHPVACSITNSGLYDGQYLPYSKDVQRIYDGPVLLGPDVLRKKTLGNW